jgi:signal transduction histidine kinase
MAELVYRGPDRRRHPSTARQRLPRWTLAATLAGALGGAALLALLARGAVPGDLRPLADAFRILATALFFGAGVLRYARWRVTGEAYVAANSAALVVFAVVAFPTSMAVRSVAATGTLGALARLVAAVTVAALLIPALSGVMVNSRLHPRRLAGAGVTVAIGVFLVLATAVDILDAELATSPVALAGLDVGAAAIWLGVAGLCLRAGVRRTSPSAAWSSAAIALLGVAGLVRGLAGDRGAGSSLVAVAALTLLAAVVAIINAGADARDALSGEGNQLLETSGALADAERLLANVEARREELVHDARSMISALDAASTTLARHADRLDEASSHRLRVAMSIELERLGRLIEESAAGPIEAFAVADVLGPVVATKRELGLDVEYQPEDIWALGRPDDVAQALRNLLVNASAHAPGSPVTVRAQSENGTVLLAVEDRGPGIPAGLRDHVFDRGVGAGPGRGSGLGLHVARRLMRAQGGDVTVAGRPGGGASFVVSLPAALAEGVEPGGSALTGEPVEGTRPGRPARHDGS